MKHVIIGGVAGGATAAARIRRIDEHAEIILFERGNDISYANCGLPYYIGGVISERDNLFLQTPESFAQRFNLSARVRSEVIAIDSEKKEVTVRTSNNEIYTETYDKLLLSPGANPVKPPLPGIDSEGIFTLRNITDTDAVKKYITTNTIQKAVVIGAGFIGLEMAENLHETGAQVSIVEMAEQVMTPIDFPMAAMVHEHLREKNVQLYLKETVSSFKKNGEKIDVIFKSGKVLDADIVILSIGVRPETILAKQANIKLGDTGGIWVDEYLQTSVPDIYAVGDAIEFPHPITNRPWLNFLAVPANRQGRIVADNMVFGNKITYEGAIGTAIAKIFDLTVAATGVNETVLTREKIPYLTSITHSNSHAEYYPGALPLTIKVNFAPETGKILGAQIVGFSGVDKRIDQIAVLLKYNKTIFDLTSIEQAYAPPFSSAKDPIAIAGYVAQNIISGTMPIVHWHDIPQANVENTVFLDVRTNEEYALGTLPNSLHIPLDDLRARIHEIPTNKKIYAYCSVGVRGYLAVAILLQRGFKQVYNLSGGYKVYLAATYKDTDDAKLNTISQNEHKIDVNMQNAKSKKQIITVDACGVQCPGPILKTKKVVDTMQHGDRVEITSTDPGFKRDSQAWCNMTGNRLISQHSEAGKYTVVIEKCEETGEVDDCNVLKSANGKTFIVFSDDLDKALAAFVLANGAASTGKKVSLFFTFWGLNVIKKSKKPAVRKDIFGKLFGFMMPSHSKKLKLSKMHMAGMGSKMMRYIMKLRGIDSLESLRQQAIENGVEFIACQMSMDVMGVKAEELLDNVTIGGVAAYMERAEQSSVNLFI